MIKSVGIGLCASALVGVLVGLWAAIAGAPPEAAGGVASVLGGGFGMAVFAVAAFGRRFTELARSACARYARA